MDKETKELFNALVEEMGKMEERLNSRMDKRFDEVDRRFDRMDNRLNQMQHEINANRLDKETISIVMNYINSVNNVATV